MCVYIMLKCISVCESLCLFVGTAGLGMFPYGKDMKNDNGRK